MTSDAEINEIKLPVQSSHDVGGFQVAEDNRWLTGMQIIKDDTELKTNVKNFLYGKDSSFFLGWQAYLEEDVLKSRQVGSRILAKAQLLATPFPSEGEVLTHRKPGLRIFEGQGTR